MGHKVQKTKIQLPKDSLKRINLGQSFAEYDKILDKPGVFVKTPAIEASLEQSKSKCFFVGRRGTGKTAIAYFLLKSFPKWAYPLNPQMLVPTSLPGNPDDFRDTRQRPFRSLISCLRRALACEALYQWNKNSLIGFSKFTPKLNRERNNIEDFDFDLRLLNFLTNSFTSLHSNNEKEWLKEINRSREIVDEVNQLGEKYKLQAFLMIDRIDEAWDGSDNSVYFLMALMHTCVELSSATKCLRPLVFLRENIFERVRQVDNEFSRLETCVVSLDWTKELLLQLIERRLNIPFNTKLPLGGETWDYFFESTPTSSSRDEVFIYCQNRPRDIITYCSFAIEAAQSHLRPKVMLEDLHEARRRFSHSRLKDLGDEYSENYPQIQLVLSRFYGLGNEFTLSGINAFIKKLLVDQEIQQYCQKWLYLYTTPERFVEILYNIGFFGTKLEDKIEFRSMGVKSANPPRITAKTHAIIHPSYVDALHLQSAIVADLAQETDLISEGIIIDLPEDYSFQKYHEKLEGLPNALNDLPHGKNGAKDFEDIVGSVIKMCFFKTLGNVEPMVREVGGTVIRDWIASNVAQGGFWEIIRQRYEAVQVVWECKNYSNLESADFQQVSYYMSQTSGRFVVIVFRGDIKNHYYEHIKRIANDKNGMVLLLKETDLKVFIRQALNGKMKENHIQEIYDKTVRTIS